MLDICLKKRSLATLISLKAEKAEYTIFSSNQSRQFCYGPSDRYGDKIKKWVHDPDSRYAWAIVRIPAF
jgi:hypothetical protein